MAETATAFLPPKLWRSILEKLSPRLQQHTLASLRLTSKALQDVANCLVTAVEVTQLTDLAAFPFWIWQ